jgi:hypothetical protein
MEDLISLAIDGECGKEDLERLKAHLVECAECRATMRAYGCMDFALGKGIDIPPAPPLPRVRTFAVHRFQRTAAGIAVAAVVALLAFLGGAWWGQKREARSLPPSYGRVAAAALWENAADPVRHEAAQAALPLSRAVTGYQLEVARLLREENVDWAKVRRLVEAIGALRTDMELLTLHVAYIEREQGKTGSAGAAWSGLLGLDDRGGSL